MRLLGTIMKNTVYHSFCVRFLHRFRRTLMWLSALILLSFWGVQLSAQTMPSAAGMEQRDESAASATASDEPPPRALPSPETASGGDVLDAGANPQEVRDAGRAQTTDGTSESADSSWRVRRSTKAPIQVRRAVGMVRAKAFEVASSVASAKAPDARAGAANTSVEVSNSEAQASATHGTSGGALPPVDEILADSDDTESSEEAGSAETQQAAGRVDKSKNKTSANRRVLTRYNPFDGIGDKVDFSKINDFAGKLLRDDGPTLVLTPYIRDPRWLEAMKLLKSDECDQAYELATEVLGTSSAQSEDTAPAIRYAMARIEMCTGAHASRGKKTLSEIAHANKGVVGVMARLRLGMPAGHDVQEVDESKHLYERIRHAKKRAANGHLADACNDLEALRAQQTRGWYKYKIRSAHVEILEDAGRYDEAAAMMLELYRNTRTWSIGDQVEARLVRLDNRASKKVFKFGERVDRMRELIQRGKYNSARQISIDNAKARGVSGTEIKGWGLYRRAMQAEKKRDREGAAKMYAQADKLVKDPAIRPRIYFGWAKALRRLDRDPEAIALYERVCSEYPRHTLCDDSLFEAGRLSQYMSDHKQARAFFKRVIDGYPNSDKVPKALWGSAFSAYLMKDYAAVEAPLRHILADYADLQDASELSLGLKAQYWLGVARLKAGDTQGAEVALQATINRGALTWYGRLAVARMKAANMEPVVHIPRSNMNQASLRDLTRVRVPDNKRLHLAAEYSRLGLYADAIESLKEQASIYPKPQRVHEFLAAVYLADGNASHAHWIMKNYIDQSRLNYQNLHDWGVAFPLNYMEYSHRFGTQYEVSPFLVQAIIRQESGFRAGVSSYAGAMGLMQLMPGTARYTQRTFLETGGHLSRSKMVQPETNVRLGTMYIRVQTAFASDRIPMALAGYNAGPAPLEDWFERFGDRELDAWVESITYREARGYVRKVYTSFVTYAGLYGDGPLPEVNLTLPKKLREWGDVPEVDRVEADEPISMLHLRP